jgi:radical SAM protein with 4Fe4S-binding SPASM domain
MPLMAATLLSYAPQFERMRVSPGFDCGFPLCVFTDEQLGLLYKLNNGRLSFGCGPAVDIGPDLSVWSCFPLSQYHKKSLYDFNNLKEIGEHYRSLHAKIRVEAGGIYQRCDSCRYRESELCMGGCLAHILASLHNEEPVRFEEVYG